MIQEHHLQAAISASHAAAVGGNVAQIYIPTPETAESAIPYAQLYQLRFAQPATYIRFSSTVEDCCGCSYNLVEEDDAFLRLFNEKLADPKQQRGGVTIQCSEDQFEEVMSFFEETAKAKQPYSSVGDPPPVLSWEEMQEAFDEDFDEPARTFARDIYEHWQARRQKNANAALQPALRLKVVDGAADADDNDPYVCFRRRELRVPRKTRGRDAQSAEKLRKLRRELEEARQLVALVRQRELAKREQLAVDRQLFEQRIAMRKVKRTLPAPYGDGDEELLVNQKVRAAYSLPLLHKLTIRSAGQEEAHYNGAFGTTPYFRQDPHPQPGGRPGGDVRVGPGAAVGSAGRKGPGRRPGDPGQEAAAHQVEREFR